VTQRLSRALRYTVYYRRNHDPERHHECEAADRDQAMGELVRHLGHKEFVVTRIVPGWPERDKKGKQP
jgi:hypothetical protein